jgi:protein-disulfide isomerase
MAQKSKKTKDKPTVGKRQLREQRRQKKSRQRAVWIGLIVLAALAVGAYTFRPRPAAGTVSDERRAANPVKGLDSSPVTITEFGDFNCPSCKAWHEAGILEQVLTTYEGQVRVIWRDFPVITPQSPKAAEAAQCAFDQERFWEYHDLLFDRAPRLNVSNLKEYALELGLNAELFNRCLDSGQHQDTVDLDKRAAFQIGLRGTPSFLVNDQPLIGGNPDQMVRMIEAILANQ